MLMSSIIVLATTIIVLHQQAMSVLDGEGLKQLGKHYCASYDHQYVAMSVLDGEGLKQL